MLVIWISCIVGKLYLLVIFFGCKFYFLLEIYKINKKEMF